MPSFPLQLAAAPRMSSSTTSLRHHQRSSWLLQGTIRLLLLQSGLSELLLHWNKQLSQEQTRMRLLSTLA